MDEVKCLKLAKWGVVLVYGIVLMEGVLRMKVNDE